MHTNHTNAPQVQTMWARLTEGGEQPHTLVASAMTTPRKPDSSYSLFGASIQEHAETMQLQVRYRALVQSKK